MVTEEFQGFPSEPNENYWQYPKSLNGHWHRLTPIEQKILDYILRHTWGWKKTHDKISLRQFRNGIKKKTGEWLDKGTGIKNNETVINGLRGLEEKGFILSEKQPGKVTSYTLKIFKPIGQTYTHLSAKPTPTINNNTILNTIPLHGIVQIVNQTKQLIDYYHDRVLEVKKIKPDINGGRDGKRVKEFLKGKTIEQGKSLIDWFIESSSFEFMPTISNCFSSPVINKWLFSGDKKKVWDMKELIKQKKDGQN